MSSWLKRNTTGKTYSIIKNTWKMEKKFAKGILAIYMIPVSLFYGLYKWYKGELG